MAHISTGNERKAPLLSQYTSGSNENATKKMSFYEKLIKAKEQGTTNKGNNPIIGIANWVGRFSHSSTTKEIDEKIAVTSAHQLNGQAQLLNKTNHLESQVVVNESDCLSTFSHSSQSITGAYPFDRDFEDPLSNVCHLSHLSTSSQSTASKLLEYDQTALYDSSQSSGLFSLSQQHGSLFEIIQPSYSSRIIVHAATQAEIQNDNKSIDASLAVFNPYDQSKTDKFRQFFWGSIKFALLPIRLLILLIRFLWNFDENIASLQDFFIHSGNMIKQSDLFLTSINDSQLVFIAASLIDELKEMTSNLRELSFDKNLSQIVENSAKISQDLVQGDRIKAIIEHSLVILDSINQFVTHFKSGSQNSVSPESYQEKFSDILTSLNTILDDMVFKGPFKGLMGAWDKYRKDRLESYEMLHNKEQFQEAVAKEVRDLEIVFKRYLVLLNKAKIKGFHDVTVTDFNYHLSRLTTKTHHMQSEDK